MIRKNNEIIVRVRMPRIHQFFHLEDKPDRAFLRISGVLSEDGGISGISESVLESKSPYLSSISVSAACQRLRGVQKQQLVWQDALADFEASH